MSLQAKAKRFYFLTPSPNTLTAPASPPFPAYRAKNVDVTGEIFKCRNVNSIFICWNRAALAIATAAAAAAALFNGTHSKCSP